MCQTHSANHFETSSHRSYPLLELPEWQRPSLAALSSVLAHALGGPWFARARTCSRRGAEARLGVGVLLVLAAVTVSWVGIVEARGQVALVAADRGQPWLSLGDGVPVPVDGPAASGLMLALQRESQRPTELASGDFDEDGVDDLISGYSGPDGGRLLMHRGNVDATHPTSPQAKRRKARGTFNDAPFLAHPRSVRIPDAPDFLATGDFDGDDHQDVVTAALSAWHLLLLPGDGRGGFGQARTIDLPGPVTTLSAGDLNRRDGLADLVVGIGGKNPRALVYEGPRGALRARAEVFELPGVAHAIAIGRIDEDGWPDLVILADRDLVLVHGRDRKLSLGLSARNEVTPAHVARHTLPFEATSMALGEFAGKRGVEVALLAPDGTVAFVSPETGNLLRSVNGVRGTRLIRTRSSGRPADDLLIVSPAERQIHVLLNGPNPDPRLRDAGPIPLQAAAEPLSVLPMHLNADALQDVVLLEAGAVPIATASTRGIQTYVVDTTSDTNDGVCAPSPGDCTLREAITAANASAGADFIEFDLGAGVPRITLSSELPYITDPVTVAGSSGDSDRVELDGSNLAANTLANGLRIQASSCTVRDMVIRGFPNSGISWEGAAGFIKGNYLGTDAAGLVDKGNAASGVTVHGSDNTIGGLTDADRNVISGNSSNGISIMLQATGNTILHNFVGVSATGSSVIGNSGDGIRIRGGSNIVGGTISLARNVISGNLANGIMVNADFNLVQGNYVGLDSGGTLDRGNAQVGMQVLSGQHNTIGGTTPGGRNVISGNESYGIEIKAIDPADAIDNVVQGNYVGTNNQGNADRGNGQSGVRIAAKNNTVGGLASPTGMAPGNLISGNNSSGVSAIGESSGVGTYRILGNLIGTNAAGSAAIGNGLDGVQFSDNAGGAELGGVESGARNVISGNLRAGVLVSSVSNVQILGNTIGANVAGDAAIPNAGVGVDLSNATDTAVGGTQAGSGNVISGNGAGGIRILGTSANNLIRRNTIGPGAANEAIGNNGPGVAINAGTNTTIGAVDGENTISGNAGGGIKVFAGTGHRISRNSIYGNTGIGIDLDGDGAVETNDPSDADVGANQRQNYPEVSSAVSCTDATGIEGSLNSTPSSPFTLEFYATAICNGPPPLDYGEGRYYVGSIDVVTAANGTALFSVNFSSANFAGMYLTSAATDAGNDTSEFSKCVNIEHVESCDPTPTPTPPTASPTPTSSASSTPTRTPTPGAAPVPASPPGLVGVLGLVLLALAAARLGTRLRPVSRMAAGRGGTA